MSLFSTPRRPDAPRRPSSLLTARVCFLLTGALHLSLVPRTVAVRVFNNARVVPPSSQTPLSQQRQDHPPPKPPGGGSAPADRVEKVLPQQQPLEIGELDDTDSPIVSSIVEKQTSAEEGGPLPATVSEAAANRVSGSSSGGGAELPGERLTPRHRILGTRVPVRRGIPIRTPGTAEDSSVLETAEKVDEVLHKLFHTKVRRKQRADPNALKLAQTDTQGGTSPPGDSGIVASADKAMTAALADKAGDPDPVAVEGTTKPEELQAAGTVRTQFSIFWQNRGIARVQQ